VTNLIVNADAFESTLLGGVAVARLKGDVLQDLATNLKTAGLFLDLLKSVNESPEVLGFVQINDRGWDGRADADAFVDLLTQEEERVPRSLWGSYKHEVLAVRLRHSIGRILLAMIQFRKTAVAGMQGEISGDYLGSTLAFDFRVATADTRFTFDSVRLGLPSTVGVTFLMPRYIGIGRTMALVEKGSTIDAHEAHSLGLVSKVIEEGDDLVERCREEILEVHSGAQTHVIEHERQNILPSVSEVEIALERYYRAMAASLNRLREKKLGA
jgi:enoyl-CoA hydratase/carnithine racemase